MRSWRALVLGGLVALLADTAVVVAADKQWWPNLALLVAVVLVCVVAWSLSRGPAGKHVVLGLVGVAVVVQVPGLLAAPITSTDAYRYVWDGRVQLSGRSPYAYVPLDDSLARLRDPVLFPGLSPAERSGVTGPPSVPHDPAAVAALSADDPRTLINRPRVPTIYPPVAQAYFAAVAFFTPWSVGTLGLQLAAAGLAVGLTAVLALELRRRQRDPRWAILWGWSPMITLEAGSAAHVDVLAAVLIAGAVIVAVRRRPVLAGVLLGAAAAVKLVPLLLLPAFTTIRGGRLRTPLVALGTFFASYLPHVLAAGTLVVGFLPGYLNQEGYSDASSRSVLLALLVPQEALKIVVAAIALTLAVVVVRLRDQQPLAVLCCWLYGGALLLTTPTYPWYGVPLVALAVLAGRLEWLAVPVASYLAYASFGHDTRQGLIYLAAGAIVVIARAVPKARTANPVTTD